MGVYDYMYLIPKEEYSGQTHISTPSESERKLSGEVHGSQVNNIEVSRGGTLLIQTDGDLAGKIPPSVQSESGEEAVINEDEKTNEESALSKDERRVRKKKLSKDEQENDEEESLSRDVGRRRRGFKYTPDDQPTTSRGKSGYIPNRQTRTPPPEERISSARKRRLESSEQEVKRARAHVAERLAQLEGRPVPASFDEDVEMKEVEKATPVSDPKVGRKGQKREREDNTDVEMREVKNVKKDLKASKERGLKGKTEPMDAEVQQTPADPKNREKSLKRKAESIDAVTIPALGDAKVRIRLRKGDPVLQKPPAIEIIPASPVKKRFDDDETTTESLPFFPPSQLRIRIGDSAKTAQPEDTIIFDGRPQKSVGDDGKKISKRDSKYLRQEKTRLLDLEKRRRDRQELLKIARKSDRGDKRGGDLLWEEEIGLPPPRRGRTRAPIPSISVSSPSPERDLPPPSYSAPAYNRPSRPLRLKVHYRGRKRRAPAVPLWEDEEESQIPYKRRLIRARRRNPSLKRAASPFTDREAEEEETNLPYKRRLLTQNEDESEEFPLWEEE